MSSQAASVNFPHAPMLPLWPANVRPLIQRWWCWGLALLIHVACLGINLSLRTAPPPPILQASLYIPATPVDPPRPTPAPIADTHPHAGPQLLPKRPAALPTAATIRSIDEASLVPAAPAAPGPTTTPPASAPAPAHTEARFDAAYLHNPKPDYPLFSRRQQEEGTVHLRVRVSTEGKPLEIMLKQTSGFPRLDQAAQETVTRWRFVPARRGEEAIESWVSIPVKFSLESI